MKSILIILLMASCVITGEATPPDWEPSGTDDGIQIFHREVPGYPVIALKGQGVIEAPLWKVATILLDTKRSPEWVDRLEESRVVRHLSRNRYIEYNQIGMPFIMKDRDFVSEVTIAVDAEARRFSLEYRPTDDEGVPHRGHVRGEILAGRFELKSLEAGKRVELVAELLCDPNGSIPKWIVNLFQKAWPLDTFRAIRRQADKTDIQMPEEFREILEETRHF